MKSIIKNNFVKKASYLSIIQVSNYLIPIITIPYLIRVLGLENYGKVLLAQTLVIFLSAITDYGYNISGVRDVSVVKNNNHEVSKHFSTIMVAKIFLLLVSIIISFVFMSVYSKLNDEFLLVVFSLLFLIGNTFLPTWYFIAKDKLSQLTILTFSSKIVYITLVFAFVSSPSDYIYVNLYMGIASIFAVVLSLYLISLKDKIKILFSSTKQVVKSLKSNFPLFTSNLSIILYQNSNIMILGNYGTKIDVGNYGSVEKIIYAEKQVLNIYSLLVFPKISFLTSISHLEIVKFLKKSIKLFFPSIIVLCFINFFFVDLIIDLAAGDQSNESMKQLYKLMSFLPLIVAINVPFYQNLLAYNKKKQTGIVLIMGTTIGLTLNFILSSYFLATGTVIAICTTEFIVSLGLIYLNEFKYREISIFRNNGKL